MDKGDKQLLDDIATYGWHVLKVFDENNKLPDFAYSVGAYHSFQQPEIILFGLDPDEMHIIINDIVQSLKEGKKIKINQPYTEYFANCNCIFRRVRKAHYDEYFGYGQWFYKNKNFPVLQCFWPDRNGKYAWERNCLKAVKERQPLLFNL